MLNKKRFAFSSLILMIFLCASARADRIVVQTLDNRSVYIDVEVARSKTERQQGLMWRKELPMYDGYLLDYPWPREVAIWMKNTFIPLDIIFIDANNKISRIFREAEPHSLKQILSGGEVSAVLEVNAGYCELMGLEIGAQVIR